MVPQADEYLAHLVGHEGAGSLLSALKVCSPPPGTMTCCEILPSLNLAPLSSSCQTEVCA